MDRVIVRLENLEKAFGGGIPLWEPLDLQVNEEESLVLIGPSGGGKSTLLKLIAGLIPPSSGTVQVQTENVGMLFQKNALFDSLSVLENLLFPLRERLGQTGRQAQNNAEQWLEAVGLSQARDLYPDEISGGMQKRLGIARALIVEPELILYDEPTAGLDPITSRTIADLILDLKRKRKSTLITVTNDVHRAFQLGTRVCMLAQGQWIEGGTPEQAKRSRNPALKQFLSGNQEGPLTAAL